MRPIGEVVRAAPALMRSARSVSFSQYGEDVLLSATLHPGPQGFYVDVGAYHPWKGSNTYKLYLRGWSGLTIEPNPQAAAAFRRFRPRDLHIVAGVAAEDGQLIYHQFADEKLNTFSEPQANIYRKGGSTPTGAVALPCRPLQAILDDLAPGRPIDLLAVDCEGFDLTALQSLDFSRVRPTAILVEDFEAFARLRGGGPMGPIETLLRGHGYEAVGQAVFSTLYLDSEALRARAHRAFRMSSLQFR